MKKLNLKTLLMMQWTNVSTHVLSSTDCIA